MAFIDEIKARAKADKKTIVLPETEDVRTYQAAEAVLKEGTADLVLVGSKEEIEKNGAGFDLTGAVIVDPANKRQDRKLYCKIGRTQTEKGNDRRTGKRASFDKLSVLWCDDGENGRCRWYGIWGLSDSTADTLRPCLQI